jgi:arylsulfatase A-like enzyme
LFRWLAGCLIGAALPMANAAVELDNAVSTNAVTSLTSSNTISLTHITGTGDNRLTLVGVSWNANTTARTISSVTFTANGGTATNLTLVRSQISAATTYRYAAVYALTNPPSGQTGTILVTFSGAVANGTAIGAANFKGVDPITPLGTSSGAGAASGATVSTSLTGLNGNELVFDTVFVGGTPPPTPTNSSGQTLLWNSTISNARGLASTKQVAAGSYTSSWASGDSTRPWAIVAVPINPAADVDTTPPTVTINQAAGQADPTTNLPINFTVIFSEPVTNFASGDVTLGGTAGATTASVTGSGTNYNVAVSGITQSGTVIASIAAGVATDAAGNPNAASTSIDNTVTFIYVPVVTTTVSSSANPAGYLTPLTFSAEVRSNGVVALGSTGAVTFSANGIPFSTNALIAGIATSDGINSLPRGTTNAILAAFSGDDDLPGSSGSLVQSVTNHPPVAALLTVTRAPGSSALIAIADLATNWSDVDADAVSLAGVNLTTTNGVTLQTNGTAIIYPGGPNVADQISYAIHDGFGGVSIGFINLEVSTSTDTLLLTSSAQTNGYLDTVTFTASVQTNGVTAGDATGDVVFAANGIPLSTNAVSGGSATSAGINSLPRGAANVISAVYVGDAEYDSSSSSLVQTITNHPPVAANVAYGRDAASSVVTIAVSNLLANVTDADSDTISLVSLGTPANGGTVTNDNGVLLYSNASIVDDQITYTVTDGFGGTNTALVGIEVTNTLITLALSSSSPVSGYQDAVSFTASLQTNGVTAGDATNTVVFFAKGEAFSTNTLAGGITTSDALNTLPRGATNLITAIYAGDDVYPAATNTFVQSVTNHPPVAALLTVTRTAFASLQIDAADLAPNWSDVDGDTVSLAGVNLTTTNGVTLQTNGTSIIYASGPNAADRISYIISDGFGGVSVGYINIAILKNPTTLALASSSPVSGYLSSVNFTALAQTNGVTAGNATGNVVFQANGVPFSTNNLSGGSATSAGISTLPRGAGNVITATYSGDSAYLTSGNTLNQTVTNHPPVAGTVNYTRSSSNRVSIAISSLLANVTDVDGDSISLVSVSDTTNGITLLNSLGTLQYDNPDNVNDQFTYTVSDGQGATNSGLVNLAKFPGPFTGKPNILLLIADDLGADSLALFNTTNNGVSLPPTPNLDKLGRSGVLFPNFYARASCSQFRAALITGRDSYRNGVGTANMNIRTNEYTLPRAFATNAPQYGVASFGKWHLAPTTVADSPRTYGGWTNFAGFFSQGVSSYTSWTKYVNGTSANTTKYSTSDQVDEAISFIQSRGTNRWFVWLAFNAPHVPRHKPPTALLNSAQALGLSGTSGDISAQPRKYWEAMVEALDTEIGRLLTYVNTNETDIIFVGDNGTEVDVQQWPYRNPAVAETTTGNGHAKFTIYEGGVRTPLFITGPSVVNGGRTNNTIVDTVDLWQTIQELAGIDVAATVPTNVIIDSKSILPTLKGDVILPRPYLFGGEFNQGSGDGFTFRNGSYKLIHFYGSHTERLYNLASDPYEYTNLLASALSPVAQSNYNDLKIQVARYLSFANTANTRNLVPYPSINNVTYTNGTFVVDAQYTQLSAGGAFPNANQPGNTTFALSGTNLSYQVILWRSTELSNPLAWTPVATNIATGLTTSFLQTTNGLLKDLNATNDQYFYRVTHYTPYP